MAEAVFEYPLEVVEGWMRERDELRIAAEMSAVDISVLITQNDELRADNERLRAALRMERVEAHEVERLQAENRGLREVIAELALANG